jgi:hypothetical protein
MRVLPRAATRWRDAGSKPVVLAALLLATSLLVAGEARAGDHSPPNDSSDSIGRQAEPPFSAPEPSAPAAEPSDSVLVPIPPADDQGSGGQAPADDDSGSEPRTAEPRSGSNSDGGHGPSRQPPTHDTRGHGSHGGGGHDGGVYDDGGSYDGGSYGGGSYQGYYWGWSPFWWANFYGYGQPYDDPGDRRHGHDSMGALDLDVSPGRTEVYIDGGYAGVVDSYDGFPRYLWLDRGTYEVVFYLDGYRTIARQITVHPGTVIDIDDHMESGRSIRPEDLASKTVPEAPSGAALQKESIQ